jgi:hypothetical protein
MKITCADIIVINGKTFSKYLVIMPAEKMAKKIALGNMNKIKISL